MIRTTASLRKTAQQNGPAIIPSGVLKPKEVAAYNKFMKSKGQYTGSWRAQRRMRFGKQQNP